MISFLSGGVLIDYDVPISSNSQIGSEEDRYPKEFSNKNCMWGMLVHINDSNTNLLSHLTPQIIQVQCETIELIDQYFEILEPYGNPSLQSYYEKGIPNDYYVYDDEYDQYLYIDEKTDTPVWSDNKPPFIRKKQMTSAFLISFAVGFVIALITMLCIKHHYRFKSQPSAQIYIPSGKIRYGGKTDQFLHKRVSRVKVESESSGSGGGGGGSSSGGFGGGGNSR